MNKLTTITAMALSVLLFVSCSKSLTTLKPEPPLPPPPPAAEKTYISDWVSPGSYSAGSDRLGATIITGTYPFTSANQVSYDKSKHVELAYARMPTGQRNPVFGFKRLAFNLSIEIDNTPSHVFVDYMIEPNGLSIYFKDAEYRYLVRAADQSVADVWKFRYIIIPKTKYQSTNVNWDDLPAVASALNFPL